ncbi:MlaD family protein [Bartonella sp. DGB2]|uniref:MlaD family protein n=1 Tax=Bartonella sp. DGB2 TaxID=3388426 RepID=UPI00398FD0E5
METKANYVLIGIFTITLLVVAFFTFLFIARWNDHRNVSPLEIRIPGSVTGLSEGSQVLFNGIRVGSVRRLTLDPSDLNMVIAQTEVNSDTPVTRSTIATLGFQGLTGLAFVELKGGSLGEPSLLKAAAAHEPPQIAQIDADPTALNNLLATAQDIFSRADAVLGELESFVEDIRQPLTVTVDNMRNFSTRLNANSDSIQKTIEDTHVMMARLNDSSKRVDQIMTDLELMLSPNNKNSVIAQAQSTLISIQKATDSLNQNILPLSENLKRFSGQGLRNIEALVLDGRRSLQRIDRALEDLDKNPQRLIFGGGNSVPQYDGRTRR